MNLNVFVFSVDYVCDLQRPPKRIVDDDGKVSK